jgi:Sec-independent protein translocase protein TatA
VPDTGKSLASFRKELSDEEFEIERKEKLFRSVLNDLGRRNGSDKNENLDQNADNKARKDGQL